jgi:hypothetical protein
MRVAHTARPPGYWLPPIRRAFFVHSFKQPPPTDRLIAQNLISAHDRHTALKKTNALYGKRVDSIKMIMTHKSDTTI